MIDKITYEAKYKNSGNIKDIYGDVKIIKRFLNNFGTIRQIAINDGNIGLIDMCTDFMNAISKCNFNKRQLTRLSLWMSGYKEYEIADIQKVSKVLIHNFIESACLKISVNLRGN